MSLIGALLWLRVVHAGHPVVTGVLLPTGRQGWP